MRGPYTMREMKTVLEYLVEHKSYGETKERKLWMKVADSLPGRTWQCLKETFQKRILPDIHNSYYGLSTEQIRSFKQGRDLTTRDEEVPSSQENDNVKANNENPRAIAENMEAVNHIREEDSQSTSSLSSSSMGRLVIDESCNQKGAESDECPESILCSKKLPITQPVVEVTDNVTERVSLKQNGHVTPIKRLNIDEIAKAIFESKEKAYQEEKRRNSLADSNRRNSMTVQANCQKTNISENLVALQKKNIKPMENLEAEGPLKKCNCSKTCALSKNNASASSDSNESTTYERKHKRINNRRQSEICEISSSDDEIPVEPSKSNEKEREERNYWKQRIILQEKKTDGIMQTLQKIQTKLDCQVNAFTDLRKQLAVNRNYSFIDFSANQDTDTESRNEGYQDKENCVKIHFLDESHNIRLKGHPNDWKVICSKMEELLKLLEIVPPTKSYNNAATATVEDLNDDEPQSQAVANNVPVRRGRQPAKRKRSRSVSVSPKGKSPRGRPKSKKNVEEDGTNKKTMTPVRKSARISKMTWKSFTEDDLSKDLSGERYTPYTSPKKINRSGRRNTTIQ